MMEIEQGRLGFEVGICPNDSLPASFEPLDGFDNPSSIYYGNYLTANNSVMVFIPAFYYRIGSKKSPYKDNAIDISFTQRDDYILHRAFIDGGKRQPGFFIDKYLASKDNDSCKSIPNADPISLTKNSNYNPSSTIENCYGIYADAITLARARGKGFHCASAFQYSALRLLSLAHGQAATNNEVCAWYDPNQITNYPKGCNNGELGDISDSEVSYASSYNKKPKTRAISGFEKTTHNGQANGVADLNGCIWQVLLGITTPGLHPFDETKINNGNVFVLKESTSIADLTAGWNGKNDAWGEITNLATKYNFKHDLLPWKNAIGWVYFGNKNNQVFSSVKDEENYLKTAIGIPTSVSNDGTNLFGQSGCYCFNKANLLLLSSGYWGGNMGNRGAGIFTRRWDESRADNYHYTGFRTAYSGII